jgi:hypothetical protein
MLLDIAPLGEWSAIEQLQMGRGNHLSRPEAANAFALKPQQLHSMC